MQELNDSSGEENPIPGLRRYPGFVSLIVVPSDYWISARNVRLWQESENSGDWFLEPLAEGDIESEWTDWSLGADRPQALYHRGCLVFGSLDGHHWVERRDDKRAIVFPDGNERQVIDLGHYIAGLRGDGAMVRQTEVEKRPGRP